MDLTLRPHKALQAMERLNAGQGIAEKLQGIFDTTSGISKAVLSMNDATQRMARLTELTDPMRDYQEAFRNSALGRMQEQIRGITENSGIAGTMAKINSTAVTLAGVELGHSKIARFSKLQMDVLNFKMPEIPEFRPPAETFMQHHPPMLTRPDPEPGEAVKILAKLQEDYDALCEEHENNPSKVPVMIAMLADGKKIAIQTARNVGDLSVELTGHEVGSGDQRELTVGIGVVSFYTEVLDVGARKPDLKIIEDGEPEDE